MIDGGLNYQRYGGVDMSMVECIGVYADEDFGKVRQHMYRTGYGKDGTGAFRITRLFEMTDGHLQALLTYPCAEWQRELVNKELAYRSLLNISVVD